MSQRAYSGTVRRDEARHVIRWDDRQSLTDWMQVNPLTIARGPQLVSAILSQINVQQDLRVPKRMTRSRKQNDLRSASGT